MLPTFTNPNEIFRENINGTGPVKGAEAGPQSEQCYVYAQVSGECILYSF